MLIDRKNRRQERCLHPESITTTNFGLERRICPTCGEVEMRNLPRETVVQADTLKVAAASRR